MTVSDGSLHLLYFCMDNPVYLKVLDILEQADADGWMEVLYVKELTGIDSGRFGDESALWREFRSIAGGKWGCGYIESRRGSKGWNPTRVSFIRAVPEKKGCIRELLRRAEA